MDKPSYTCNIDAEPLHRYQRGGYHPVCLGDVMNEGRYRILHKLGWGGYSTVWVARDQRIGRYVAIKISVSERRVKSKEVEVMQLIRSTLSDCLHVIQMLDHFECQGPNGSHNCLVLELLGPNVSDVLDERFNGERLPGKLAKSIARQCLSGLDCLHKMGVGHGDLHIRNLAFSLPTVNSLNEAEFFHMLGTPETENVVRRDGKPLEPGIPKHLVRPTSFPIDYSSSTYPIKIIDFGESFLSHATPATLHTPLPVRAPEVIFGEQLDYRVDLWSMGCMLFELIVGQPPFDSFMITLPILVGQMLEMASDGLPDRWQPIWHGMDGASTGYSSETALQAWLEDMYFDGERKTDLTREDIVKIGHLIGRMLLFEPSLRASAEDVFGDAWFKS